MKAREVVSVMSEPHGSHTFVYDVATGKRILPNGDLSNVTSDLGARQASLLQMFESLDRNKQ